MVDVGHKPETQRRAQVSGSIRMAPATFAMIAQGSAKKGDVLGIARIAAETASNRAARARDTDMDAVFQSFIWPARGAITGVFGSQRILNGEPKQPHYGVDVAGPVGAPVIAPADGIVSLTNPDMFFSGGTLYLDHGHGVSSAFLHLSKILVKPGQAVKQGEKIALIGKTGRVTGAHLDWRVNWFESRVDATQLVAPIVKGRTP